MIDIKLIREDEELVKENMRHKFQEDKLYLVDDAKKIDKDFRELKSINDEKRKTRNNLSNSIGTLMRDGKKEEADKIKDEVRLINDELTLSEIKEKELETKLKEIMYNIPNIMHKDVPIGKDDGENVELEQYGEKKTFNYEIPYHMDIITCLGGEDLDAARRVAGSGFYYLEGDVARLHSAVLAYARDFMINKGFKYCIPPFMVRSDVVTGVMSFEEMDAMMYKIEGEDLFLIGTSEHSMIGKFKDQIVDLNKMPYKMTSYSPCFRKEKGAHGIEERGIYRVHQFEKQEMVVVCHPRDSEKLYDELWKASVEIFRNMEIPVRTLECCSGDLADLKYKSLDIEAWSPRQGKYFEVCSCSNLTDAQARRLGIRYKDEAGTHFAHTLNNTVIAAPRMLIAILENNYQEDGSVVVPEVLRPYMGGTKVIKPEA